MKAETVQQYKAAAVAFVANHLEGCAANLVELADTGEVPYGPLRELMALFEFEPGNSLAHAKAEVERQVLQQYLVLAAEKKPFSGFGYVQAQRQIAAQQDATLEDDSTWRFELWFYNGETPFHELTPYGVARAGWNASRLALTEQVDELLMPVVQDYTPVSPAV